MNDSTPRIIESAVVGFARTRGRRLALLQLVFDFLARGAVVLVAMTASVGFGQEAESFPKQVQPLLAKYCTTCHGGEKPEGDFSIGELNPLMSGKEQRDRWTAVLTRMRAGEMPPKDEARPSDTESQLMTKWIEQQLRAAVLEERKSDGRAVLRRLNRTEYENTVCDLLGIKTDLKELLALDGSAEGFDNVGTALHVSSFALERYLEAGHKALHVAIANTPRPPLFKKRIDLRQQLCVKKPEQQVERMLSDPKAAALSENFVGQWLGLRLIDFTEPNYYLYPEFDHMLKVSMIRETELFFDEVLKHDLSLVNFVDSGFSMLNGRLARHYGIPGLEGWEFQKVTLPKDSHRGGVLTMGSVLKVTANGSYTHPVHRGVWVLERILGKRPPNPPANIPVVEPDIRGAKGIRDQLAKHREGSYAACHVQIAPPDSRWRVSMSLAADVIGEDKSLRIYVNGKLAVQEKAKTLVVATPKQPLEIGRDQGGSVGDYESPNPFDGQIDEVRLFLRELTDAEIATNATDPAKAKAQSKSAALALTFDKSTVEDSGPHANSGTANGVAYVDGKAGKTLERDPGGGRKKGGKAVAAKPKQGANAASYSVKHNWHNQVPLFARAMVLAGDTLFVAGPPDLIDEEESFQKLTERDTAVHFKLQQQDEAWQGKHGGILYVVNTKTGEKQHEYKFDSIPTWDGLAAAQGQLFMTTIDGKVVCLKGSK